MTREEAIYELSNIFAFGFYNDRVDEAVNMAIKALEQQTCDNCKHNEETNGMNCYECVKGISDNFEALQQEPKQRHGVSTPKEFAEKMYQIAESGDAEADHVKADELMCQLLTSLGYGEGVKIFRNMYKWY